jgi:hypothetical protein
LNQGLPLARQVLYHISHTPHPLSVLFKMQTAGDMDQIEESMPSKSKAQSSNPSTAQKKKVFLDQQMYVYALKILVKLECSHMV